MKLLSLLSIIPSIVLLMNVVRALEVNTNNVEVNVFDGNSNNFSFIFTPSNVTDVFVQSFPSTPFSFNFSQQTFNSVQLPREVAVKVSVPKYTPAGTYRGSIFVSGEGQSKEIIVNVNVPSRSNVTIIKNQSTFILNTSQKSGVVYIPILNDGNVFEDVLLSSNSSILAPIPTKIPAGSTIDVPILYNFNSVGNVSALLSTNTSSSTITLILKDDVKPTFGDISYPNLVQALEDVKVVLFAFDDVGIDHVELSGGNSVNMSKGLEGKYFGSVKYTSAGGQDLIIRIYDTSGNSNNATLPITISPISDYQVNDFIAPQIIANKSFSKTIFKSEIPLNVTVTLSEFEVRGVADYRLEMVADGDVNSLNLNSSLDAIDVKKIELILEGNKPSTFNGKIILEFPGYLDNPRQEVAIRGSVGALEIKDKEEIFFGDKKLLCSSNYTGSLETSVWDCSFSYPITTELNQLGIFLTKQGEEEIKNLANEKANLLQKELSTANLIIIAVGVSLVVALGYIFYMSFFFGKRRVKLW